MGNFKAGRYIPTDTSDSDAWEDFKFGGGFLLAVVWLIGSVICLLYLLIR